MQIHDHITYIGEAEDWPFLSSKLFDVNIRLLKSSAEYKNVIQICCNHIRLLLLTKFEDYPHNFGMSGANVAIPFNIIGIVQGRETKNPKGAIFINPRIHWKSAEMIDTLSNCGSIRLIKPIAVRRHQELNMSWYDINGEFYINSFTAATGGNTLQHEIEHNLGILITDQMSH